MPSCGGVLTLGAAAAPPPARRPRLKWRTSCRGRRWPAARRNGRQGDWSDARLRTVTTIGDAPAPSTIASAVHSGHKLGGELDLTVDDPALNIRCEVTALADDYPSTGPSAEGRIAAPPTQS